VAGPGPRARRRGRIARRQSRDAETIGCGPPRWSAGLALAEMRVAHGRGEDARREAGAVLAVLRRVQGELPAPLGQTFARSELMRRASTLAGSATNHVAQQPPVTPCESRGHRRGRPRRRLPGRPPRPRPLGAPARLRARQGRLEDQDRHGPGSGGPGSGLLPPTGLRVDRVTDHELGPQRLERGGAGQLADLQVHPAVELSAFRGGVVAQRPLRPMVTTLMDGSGTPSSTRNCLTDSLGAGRASGCTPAPPGGRRSLDEHAPGAWRVPAAPPSSWSSRTASARSRVLLTSSRRRRG